MEKMKRMLALLLVFAMLLPNLTTIALAAETEEISVISTETVVETEATEAPAEWTEPLTEATEPPTEQTEAPTEETEPPTEQTVAPTEETEPPTEQTEAPTEETMVVVEVVSEEETISDSPMKESAQQEITGSEVVTETRMVESTVAADSKYSNDDMFAMYVDRLLYPNKPSTLGTGGFDNLPDAAHQNLYRKLQGKASVVAAEGGSTEFTLSTEELTQIGFTATITAEALGLADSTTVPENLDDLVEQQLGINMGVVVRALLADCPYDLYWYDKETGCGWNFAYSIYGNSATGKITKVVVTSYNIAFPVVEAYKDADYVVSDTSAKAADQVVQKAADVVAADEGKSDYDKLVAYKDYICEQVDYNWDAVNNNEDYGDPWQIIYVFDEDPDTNVVCEGYAKAFQYLCDLSEFEDAECFLVSGCTTGPHMWNIVSIDGRNYIVDVTATDPSEKPNEYTLGQDGSVFMTGTPIGSIAEGYTFTNTWGDEMHYAYRYENEYGKTVATSIEVYGAQADSILNLSDITYAEYLQQKEEEEAQQQEQAALLEELAEGATLDREVVITAPATFNNLTVAEGGKLIIQGAAVTISGESQIDYGTVELIDGAELIVQGNLYLSGGYDSDTEQEYLGTLKLHAGTELSINGEDRYNTEGRIYVSDFGSIAAAENTVSVPDGTVTIQYGRGRQTGVPQKAQFIAAMITDEGLLADVADQLYTVHEDGTAELNYGGAEIRFNQDLTINGEVALYGEGIEIRMQDDGLEEDRVTVTLAEGAVLTLIGGEVAVQENTELIVEGTLNNFSKINLWGGRLICKESSHVNVLNDGVVNNWGTFYVAGQLTTEAEGSTSGKLEGNAFIDAREGVASFLSLRWLNNWGNGWFEDHDNMAEREIRLTPGQDGYAIAYLNQWNDDTLDWDMTPIHATKLVAGENLVLEPFRNITDGGNHTQEGENFDCFFRVRAAEGCTFNQETTISYSNTGIQLTVKLERDAFGFYSADPTAEGADVNSLWLNEFCVSKENRVFYFYFDSTLYREGNWKIVNAVSADSRQATAEKVKENLWKITITEEAAENIYTNREFHFQLSCEVSDGNPSYPSLRCYAGDFGEPNASFDINGVRYNASWNYDGLFRYEQDGNGDWYPVPAEIKGVSYDIHSNTLTLDGAHLETLHIDHHWHDDRTGEEGWNLPDSRFNIELVGDDNTITATNEHALLISDDVHLTILGEGSLTVSSHDASSAFLANDSDVTIAGNAKVTVQISGEVHHEENGEMRRVNMNPIWCNGADRWLRLRDNAVLTTHVPEGVCTNGYFAEDGTFVDEGGYNGIQFFYIEVNDNATLNTQTIRVWDEGRDNAYGAYYQNGGTVNVTGLSRYNKDNLNENGTVGRYHYSGLEADYGQIEINGGVLNINIHATEEQMAKSAYYDAIQSRGSHIGLNGGEINVNANISGTGIMVGEDDCDGGTNAWVDFNNGTLNMVGSNLYRRVINVAPNGSINFNGGVINAKPADIDIRGEAKWYGTQAYVEGGAINIYGAVEMENGYISIKHGNFRVWESGELVKRNAYVELDNSFVYVAGKMRLENGSFIQSLDSNALGTEEFVTAFMIDEGGLVELCGDAYLNINGTGKVDGIDNAGTFRQFGGSMIVDVDETIVDMDQGLITAALFGNGKNRFEDGYASLDGYYAIFQINQNGHSELYVGGNATLDAVGQESAIISFAPVVFEGGSVNAYAAGEIQTVTDGENNTRTIYPHAILLENNDGGTNASLTIKGGNHRFGTPEKGDYPVCSRGLGAYHALVTFEGGNVTIDAEIAVYNVTAKGAESTVKVPVIVNQKTGEVLELVYSESGEEGLYTVSGKVGFLTSQNCGRTEEDNVQWRVEKTEDDTVLIISGTGDMDDYYMPIRDPDSWRTAPWYAMRDAITKVVVEEGIKHVGDWAFGRLPEVTEIVYSSTVNRIDMSSNYDCPKLEKFTVAEGNEVYSVSDEGKVLIENGSLVRAAVKGITSYKAGDDIRTIGMGAFDSSNLTELDLNKVQVIQNYAFADCYHLKEVVIPEGVTTIDMTVFQNSGLETVTIPASVTKIRNYAFDGCSALTDVYYAGTEGQWNAIVIGSGNNALLYIPITFMGTAEEEAGEPYLSYRLVKNDGSWYEDTNPVVTNAKSLQLLRERYVQMVVYLSTWNEDTGLWKHTPVDPEDLTSENAALEIFSFRDDEDLINSIRELEPNADCFIEVYFKDEPANGAICYKGTDLKIPVEVVYYDPGFYTQKVDMTNEAERKQYAVDVLRVNPNAENNSVYFGIENPDITAVTVSGKTGYGELLTEDDLKAITVTQDAANKNMWLIEVGNTLADRIFECGGFELTLTYTYGENESGTVTLECWPVGLNWDQSVSFTIDGRCYEYFPGVEGFFWWDEENGVRRAYENLPENMSYDYESDTLTMNNTTIESLQVYWNWHDDWTGKSGYATKDDNLTLELIGTNKIVNPYSHAALAVGDGLTLTITSEESSTLLISATNEKATADNYAQNAVNIYNDGDLVIAGKANVTTFIGSNDKMTEGWLMNMWLNGNNTLTIKDDATLTTTVPAGARDDGDGRVNGYRGIDWFGEIRVQGNATLNTSTLGLGEYFDENNNYCGSGRYIQEGGTVTIEALGFNSGNNRHGYNGLRIDGGTSAIINDGTLIIQANEANMQQETFGENGTYEWFNGMHVRGHLQIAGSETLVEIRIPNNGAGVELVHTTAYLHNGATIRVVGNGHDTHALNVIELGNFQLDGGIVDVIDSRVRITSGSKLEIHDGTLSIVAKDYPRQTSLEIERDSGFILHNGDVVVDSGIVTDRADDEQIPNAVSVGGHMELNGGTMTVSGTNGLGVHNNAGLYQNGAVLKVNGFESTFTCDDNGEIHLNGGDTEAVLGKTGEAVHAWGAAVNVYDGGRLEVNDGHHTFRVAATPGEGYQLYALNVNGSVNFNGGTVVLDAGSTGDTIFNRTYGEHSTVCFNYDLGAIAAESGVRLDMHFRGENSDNGERYFSLGTEEAAVSKAKIIRTSVGNNASWHIEKDGDKTTLIISGDWEMYNYYMPENDPDWDKTPWFDEYKDQITHVIVEEGINTIGNWVFAWMPNLVNVKLPGSVNHISTSAFYGCTALENFTMQGSQNYNLDDNTCGEPDDEGYRTGTVIIEGGWKVLKAAPSVKEYVVPGYISEIGNGAFQNCTELTSITFETDENDWSNVWNIGNNAFENTGLTKIELPEGIQSIGRNAFAGCESVTEITLPASLNAIRHYAFDGCGNTNTTVTFAGDEKQWSQISKGDGNSVLDRVDCQGGEVGEEDAYLSFRWLDNGEDGWQENQHPATSELSMPADLTYYGVFYYNHWDGEKWIVTSVDPEDLTVGSGITIRKMDAAMMKEYDWKIAEGEINAANFVALTTKPNSWGGDGNITYKVGQEILAVMEIPIQRGQYGFYATNVASNDTWLNDYEMNPLQKPNEFYFIFENSENEMLDTNSIRKWNHNGVPDAYFRINAMGNGVYKITLDPIFLQDAWRYGHGIRLYIGFDVTDRNGENRRYEETDLQLKGMDLGRADATLEINDHRYLYFAEQKGWMTDGDPANDYRPGVVNLPAGVSYSYNKDTGEQILTLNNAKLNNLSLNYRVLDENGELTEETRLPNENLTIHLVGNSLIESGHREALRIDGSLNVTVTGYGSLKLHSHNDPETRDEWGNRYAFDTVVVGKNSTLTIAGGNVTAEISGEGFWHEGNPAMPAALRGRDNASLVVSGGSLTTVVPENARDNGPEEVDFEHYYSTHAIGEFENITVSGGTLNTTSLYVNEGETYQQTGGIVNITGLGHISLQWNENGDQYQNYHYNGIQVHDGATAQISGGELNLTVTPKDWEYGSSSYYSGLNIAGGEATISGTAKIHVTGAFEGSAISVGHDFDHNGQPYANGTLTMTGGTLTVSNTRPGSMMYGLDVADVCTANITGGTLNMIPADGFGGISNRGDLTIGGEAVVKLNEAVWSNGDLTVTGNADIDVTHAEGTNMYAWDIVPGTSFHFESGTITAKNAVFWIGGEMQIGKNAVLNLEDSDFNADGEITLDGSLTMTQKDLVDNLFLGEATDEWGNKWDEYEYQSRLYVTGVLNLNSGSALNLTNVPMNIDGSAVVNQNGATVSMTNAAVPASDRQTTGDERNDWIASVNVEENATLNINGGSFAVNNTDVDGGMNLRGSMNMRNGTLTVDVPGGIAIAARGQVNVSGGTMTLKGDLGYEQAYEDGFDHGKLTVTGGELKIEAVSGGIDASNNVVVTGGQIDIDVSGRVEDFAIQDEIPVHGLYGTGIVAYNDEKSVSVSINGGIVNIEMPVDPQGYDEVQIFALAGFNNGTIRINGGDVHTKGNVALYAESKKDGKHIVINNRLHVLSLVTGNTLNMTSGRVEAGTSGHENTWYIDTFEEDEIFTTPVNNVTLEGYATDLRIVSKAAGTNSSWDMEDGVLTISAPSGTVGTMVKDAGWNPVADKVVKLILDPSIDKNQVDVDALDLMTGLKSVKTPHDAPVEEGAKARNVGIEYFHDLNEAGKCTFEGCALATFTGTLKDDSKSPQEKLDDIQQLDKEELKEVLENSENPEDQKEKTQLMEQLDQQIKEDKELIVEVKTDEEHKDFSDVLDVPEGAKPQIVGAALNAEEESKKIALVIGESTQNDPVDKTQYEKVVRFSMELTTTDSDGNEEELEELKTPVQITLPLPNGMDVDRLVILHYHDESGEPEEVDFIHTPIGGHVFVSFWVTGFSNFDFRMTYPKLQVVMDDLTMNLGDPIPAPSWTILDESGNTVSKPDGLTITPKVNGGNPITEAGTYTITAEITKDNTVLNEIEVVDGELTVKGKLEVTISLTGATLELENLTYINIFSKVVGAEDYDIEKNMGLLIWNGEDEDFQEDQFYVGAKQTQVYQEVKYDADKGMYKVTTPGIAAKRLGEERYMRVYIDLGDGNYAYSKVTYYGPQKYALDRLVNSADEDLKRALVAMLDYAAAAQLCFDYHTSDLANAIDESYLSKYRTVFSENMLQSVVAADSSVVGELTRDRVHCPNVNPTLLLEAAVENKYYFKFAENIMADVETAKIMFWNKSGYERLYNSSQQFAESNATVVKEMQLNTDGAYVGIYDQTPTKRMGETLYLCAMVTTKSGETYYSGIISHSTHAYIVDRLTNSQDEKLKETIRKMAVFGEMTKVYFDNKE